MTESPRKSGLARFVARYAVPLMAMQNVIWGASYLAADIALKEMTPDVTAAWRFLFTTVLMAVILFARRTPVRMKRTDYGLAAVMGFVGIAVSYVLVYEGILYSSATDRALASPLEPVILALMGAVFLRERLNRRQVGGIVLAFIGAYLLAARSAISGEGWQPRYAVGMALILLAFFTESLVSLIGKPLVDRYHPLSVTTWALAFGALFLMVECTVRTGFPQLPTRPETWWALAFLVIPCTVIGYTLWYACLEHMPVGVIGAFIFIQPVVGFALGMAFEGQKLSIPLLSGAVLICLGVYLTGRQHKPDEITEPSA
ncbi:MAG: EamA family transporter [Armatimonadetes bacterium]|nr:EamA family transporter [Armatimonadota bacterium]